MENINKNDNQTENKGKLQKLKDFATKTQLKKRSAHLAIGTIYLGLALGAGHIVKSELKQKDNYYSAIENICTTIDQKSKYIDETILSEMPVQKTNLRQISNDLGEILTLSSSSSDLRNMQKSTMLLDSFYSPDSQLEQKLAKKYLLESKADLTSIRKDYENKRYPTDGAAILLIGSLLGLVFATYKGYRAILNP
jgi:hypothetical protein